MNNLDLIRQYVNTGRKIGDYQVSKLPNSLLGSYLRKRLQTSKQNIYYELTDKEFELLTPEDKLDYIVTLASKGYYISNDQFKILTPELKHDYVIEIINNVGIEGIHSLIALYDYRTTIPIIGKENLKRVDDDILRDFLYTLLVTRGGIEFEDYRLLELYFGKERIENIRKEYDF